MNRKCFGWAHKNPESNEMEGSLALFCPACPQPGTNLEDDWRQRYPEYKLLLFLILVILMCFFRWLMCRIIVTDGNFKAELLKPKNPEIDVALTAGFNKVALLLVGLRKKQIWTRKIAKVAFLPSFYLVIHSQLSVKSPLESLIMLFKRLILSMTFFPFLSLPKP